MPGQWAWAALALSLAACAWLWNVLWRAPRAQLARFAAAGVPTKPFVPLVGCGPEIQRHEDRGSALTFFTEMRRELGPVHAFAHGPWVMLMVLEPEGIKQVLRTHRDKYHKSSQQMKHSLRPLLGDGVLMSEGETWGRERKLLAPAFHFNSLRGMVPLMVGATRVCLGRWGALFRDGEPSAEAELQHRLSDMTLEIVATAAFGRNFLDSDETRETLHHAFGTVLQELQDRAVSGVSILPGLRSIPSPSKRRVDRGCAEIGEVVRRSIRERRSGAGSSSGNRDLLDILVEAGAAGGMSEQYMVDEAITFVFAAFETVANCFVWLLRLLVERPDEMRRCVDEVERVLGGREPEYDDLRSLEYLNAVFMESLRLYPPAPMISKYCTEAHSISLADGREVPIRPGDMVTLNSYLVHRDARNWEAPDEFRPSRWLGAGSAPKFGTFLAFSEGARACLGKPFAVLEAKVMLSMILQRFELSEVEGQDCVPTFRRLNLVPKGGYRVRLRDRQRSG